MWLIRIKRWHVVLVADPEVIQGVEFLNYKSSKLSYPRGTLPIILVNSAQSTYRKHFIKLHEFVMKIKKKPTVSLTFVWNIFLLEIMLIFERQNSEGNVCAHSSHTGSSIVYKFISKWSFQWRTLTDRFQFVVCCYLNIL